MERRWGRNGHFYSASGSDSRLFNWVFEAVTSSYIEVVHLIKIMGRVWVQAKSIARRVVRKIYRLRCCNGIATKDGRDELLWGSLGRASRDV